MADLQLIIYLADIKLYAAEEECVFLNMAPHSKAPLQAVGINSFKGDTELQVGRKDSRVPVTSICRKSQLRAQQNTTKTDETKLHSPFSPLFRQHLKFHRTKKSYVDSQIFYVR